MAESQRAPQVDPGIEEVRLAMALNGGVSLAVWMGGCAVELDCARRAWLGPEELAFAGYEPGETGATRRRDLYHRLGRACGRRLSIDVLAGASAGGVNGALLSAAMVAGRRLHPQFVRDRWLELGDLSLLLRDPRRLEAEPRSLMDGQIFRRELLRAFRALQGEEERADGADPDAAMLAAAELPVEQENAGDAGLVPDLDVTITDAIGTELAFPDDWGLPLVAREHGPRFEFRRVDDYRSETLADAARASASFPLAFEPLALSPEQGERAGLKEATFAIDGGLLDNAPIRAALDRIPFRRAATLVRRYACYVNADPTPPQPAGADGPAEPGVADVLGYIVNLPRTAPFAQQLYAVREATNRPLVTQAIVSELLTMDLGALEQTATALLPAYRRRRTASSIEELIEDPAAARAARDAVDEHGTGLLWIPQGDALAPPVAGLWDWGIRPAQRILALLLDLLREALAAERPAPESLLALRARLDERIEELERLRGEVVAEAGAGDALASLSAALEARRGEIYDLLETAAGEVAELGDGRGDAFAQLFRPPREGAEPESQAELLELFFRRVLAIEVVRRALADDVDVDTGQRLSFVQLTPAAPTPILSAQPLSAPAPPAAAADKLLGVGLGHFAGFYRRAWRANDFMWGRLDAAARIVDILLDRPLPHTEVPADARLGSRANLLTDAVLGSSDPNFLPGEAERHLIQEALADHKPADGPPAARPPAEGLYRDGPSLRRRVFCAIYHELRQAPAAPRATDLPFTRTALARAAQLEVLRDELPVLVAEARADGDRGSSGLPLELGEDGSLPAMIEALRAIEADPEDSLPQRLTGESEATSRLGMTTLARAGRIGIEMLAPAAPPPSKAVGLLRAPARLLAALAPHDRLRRLAVRSAAAVARLYRRLTG